MLRKLLLEKLVTGEASVGELVVGELVVGEDVSGKLRLGKLRWGSNLTPFWIYTGIITVYFKPINVYRRQLNFVCLSLKCYVNFRKTAVFAAEFTYIYFSKITNIICTKQVNNWIKKPILCDKMINNYKRQCLWCLVFVMFSICDVNDLNFINSVNEIHSAVNTCISQLIVLPFVNRLFR